MENMLGSVGKSVTDFAPISGKSVTELGKSVTDLGEICHRFWRNPSPIFGKSLIDFGKSATDLGKTCHRFWEVCHRLWGNQPPTYFGNTQSKKKQHKRLELCPKPIQNGACLSQTRRRLSSVGGWFSQKRSQIFPKSVTNFPKVGGGLPRSRWRISPKSVTDFLKIGDRFP